MHFPIIPVYPNTKPSRWTAFYLELNTKLQEDAIERSEEVINEHVIDLVASLIDKYDLR